MRLTISEFKNTIGHAKDKSSIKAMDTYLKEYLLSFGVMPASTTLDPEAKWISVMMTPSEKKLFLSKEDNMIKLAPGDKRIKEDGRDFLKSRFLTKKQFIQLKRALSTGFQAIGIDCVIRLHENEDDLPSSILLVDTANGVNNISKLDMIQKTFPIDKNPKVKGKKVKHE